LINSKFIYHATQGIGKENFTHMVEPPPNTLLPLPSHVSSRSMKKTLYYYLLKEITVPFLLGMAAFTSVLLMGRLLKLADLVVAKGVPLTDIVLMIVYLIPSFCLVTIPMAFLLALLLAFGRLSADSEITAIKASGVSLYGLLPPVLLFALIAYMATTFITIYALPWGNISFKKLLFDIMESRVTLSLKEKVFNDEFPGLVIYTDLYDPRQHTMTGILIHDDRDPLEPSTIFADRGVIIADPVAKMLRVELHNGGIHKLYGKNGYRQIEFQDYRLSINLSHAPREMVKNEMDLTFRELREGISSTRTDPKILWEMHMEFNRRFALPFACFVFAMVGVPLGIQNHRSGKATGFSLSIGVILIYYIIFSIGKTLGEKGLADPAVAVWTPNLILLAIGIYLFKKTASEQKILLFEAIPSLVAWADRKLGSLRQHR
jgi:lipopolysaccharide export system permease protein